MDNPPEHNIFFAMSGSTNIPTGLISNACFVLQFAAGVNKNYCAQLAFSFGKDMLAIRRKSNSTVWESWKYITFS